MNDTPAAPDAPASKRVWFIRRGGAWFRPHAQGYTNGIIGAGTFSESVARAYERSCEGITIYPDDHPMVARALTVVFENASRLLSEIPDARKGLRAATIRAFEERETQRVVAQYKGEKR